jgi:hypothetical protein
MVLSESVEVGDKRGERKQKHHCGKSPEFHPSTSEKVIVIVRDGTSEGGDYFDVRACPGLILASALTCVA